MWKVSFKRDYFLLILLVLLCLFLFVFKLGEPSLWNMDEPIYGEVAKEILKLGDWITLHFNYQEWFDKPPLYIWLTALTFKAFGWNEFTTRIWSSLFGIGGVVVVYFLGKSIFEKKTGFFSALILATSLQYIIQSRLALLDVPLSFFISLSILFFYLGYKTYEKRWYYLLSFIFMALATLTKGPIGVLLPGLIIGLYLLLTANTGELKRMMLFRGVLIYLAIASPWYAIELMRHGHTFMDSFFFQRTAARFLTPFEGHTGPPYYYLVVLLFGFFPWSSFLPYALVRFFKKGWKDGEREKILLILIWFGVVFVFFSSAKSKLPGYILPLYPCLAPVVGKLWSEFSSQRIQAYKRGMLLSFALFFSLLISLLVAVVLIAKPTFPVEYELCGKDIIIVISGLIIGGVFSLLSLLYKKPSLCLGVMVGAMCFVTWALAEHVLPKTEFFKPTKVMASEITSRLRPGERIGNYPASEKNFMTFNPSLVYYTDQPVVGIETVDCLMSFLGSEERVYCLMSEKSYFRVKENLSQIPVYVLRREGGEVLLSNKGDR